MPEGRRRDHAHPAPAEGSRPDGRRNRRRVGPARASSRARSHLDQERIVRITLHLDGLDGPEAHAYAIVWIDTATARWSREGHAGIDLPVWGRVAVEGHGIRMTNQDGCDTCCLLEDFDFAAGRGPAEGQGGPARWWPQPGAAPVAGTWRAQCIDRSSRCAEHEVFTGQER
ncbi:DUF3564 domain-containing protein [Burkholderia glumae]|nr:DUF3564 domain-containing protein [Burkholderia glumae]RQZ74611.1 DUF3564 domain-containing protein [Burkholderia glumae]UVS87781.1 DUF3564 domain-containing protein [Burkholderia glumae]